MAISSLVCFHCNVHYVSYTFPTGGREGGGAGGREGGTEGAPDSLIIYVNLTTIEGTEGYIILL